MALDKIALLQVKTQTEMKQI